MGEERRGDERKAKEIEGTVVCNTQLAEVGDLGRGAGIKSGERHGGSALEQSQKRQKRIAEVLCPRIVLAACLLSLLKD